MKTCFQLMAFLTLAVVGLAEKPAQAQVSVGIATPGFALGVGPGAGYLGGGYYPGYPVVVPPPVYVPRPVYLPPPIYGRPYYGGYARGPYYGYGPHYGYPHHYRR